MVDDVCTRIILCCPTPNVAVATIHLVEVTRKALCVGGRKNVRLDGGDAHLFGQGDAFGRADATSDA